MEEKAAAVVPTVLDGVAWIDVDGDIVALDPEAVEVHLINGTGAAIWTRIDGRSTTDEIIDSLAADFTAPRDVIEHDVLSFTEQAVERRLLRLRDRQEAVDSS